MAERKTVVEHATTEASAVVAEPLVAEGGAPHAWTLDEAFMVLTDALAAHFDAADNMPQYLRAKELQIIKTNGNDTYCWAHVVLLLEDALRVALRVS